MMPASLVLYDVCTALHAVRRCLPHAMQALGLPKSGICYTQVGRSYTRTHSAHELSHTHTHARAGVHTHCRTQGLTVLVDDAEGLFRLNPTKEAVLATASDDLRT
jgi:hypothetical protein